MADSRTHRGLHPAWLASLLIALASHTYAQTKPLSLPPVPRDKQTQSPTDNATAAIQPVARRELPSPSASRLTWTVPTSSPQQASAAVQVNELPQLPLRELPPRPGSKVENPSSVIVFPLVVAQEGVPQSGGLRWETPATISPPMPATDPSQQSPADVFVGPPFDSVMEDLSDSVLRAETSVPEVLEAVGRENAELAARLNIQDPWWYPQTAQPISGYSSTRRLGLEELVQLALLHSTKLRIASFEPSIRRTSISEAAAEFDWNQFANTMWNDLSDPIGSTLTAGGSATRFRDHDLAIDYGLRKKDRTGGNFELLRQWGFQDNNSTFFVPDDQATSRVVLRYTHPLMKGRGRTYNESLICLAAIDTQTTSQQFQQELQDHMLELARAYWTLHLERASLVQKTRLYLKTVQLTERLQQRRAIDAARSQIVQAEAALQSRQADLFRARTAVKNAETQLRVLVNAPLLAEHPERIEFLPSDHPVSEYIATDLATEFETALQHRPEIGAAFQSIRASAVRLNMARHEILPELNLITETYVAGLRGDADFFNAWLDQFRTGEPGYTLGLEFELPYGRRAARARLSRRQLERAQMHERYRNALEVTRAEIEVAVREIETAHRELSAKYQAWKAAELEARTIEQRWMRLAEPDTTGSLALESLLRSQERLTQAEFEYAKVQLNYNMSIFELMYANGTLCQVLSLP